MDIEQHPHAESEQDPLLPQAMDKGRINLQHWLYPHAHFDFTSSRQAVRHYLASKTGHYFVLGLVCLDVSAIFADFVINLFKCEQHWGDQGWDEALEVLSITGLVFSALFVLELFASIWAFGWSYFDSKFHIFDAFVIIAGFTLDILLRGPLEEAVSLIIVLRLWRVFKIIEELSVGAQEQIDSLVNQISILEKENSKLMLELSEERKGKSHLERAIEQGRDGGQRVERSETPPTPD